MTSLVAACGNLRILILRIEEAIAFNLPLDQVQDVGLATQYAENFLNELNNNLVT